MWPYLFKEVRSDPLQHLILPAIPRSSTKRNGIREFKNRLEPPIVSSKVSPAIEEEEKGRDDTSRISKGNRNSGAR